MATDRPTSPSRTRPSSRSPKKRPTRSFWIKTLAEFSKSGLSAQQFCRLKNLSPSNFSTWRKRLREEEAGASAESASFIPLEVRAADNPPAPSNESVQNQQITFSPDIEKTEQESGLSIHLNGRLKIFIDRDFHEPTLQRLVKLFSLRGVETC